MPADPIAGTVDVEVPVDVLWECFRRPRWWPRWNACMYAALNEELVEGDRLLWGFEPIRPLYPYKLPGVATLVEVAPRDHVTWEVTALPGFFARHTYSLEDLGGGRTRFGSWEQATGPAFRALAPLWRRHFVFVRDRSLEGARFLEQVYRYRGRLDETVLPAPSYVPLAGRLPDLRHALEEVRPRAVLVAPGVHAVLGGGGNSLVVEGGDEALVVDTKLPPFAGQLRRWIDRAVGLPVRTVVNTHFHFDHTWGNGAFAGARVVAHRSAPRLMLARDGAWWRRNRASLPRDEDLVDAPTTLQVGDKVVHVEAAERAHTAADLWAHVQVGGVDVVAVGDIATLDVYPFFDLGEGGADIPGTIRALDGLADRFPDGRFVPGHGNLASAADLRRHAVYLAFLWDFVARARADGRSESEAARAIDVAPFGRARLPILHYGVGVLDAGHNVRAAYRLHARAESAAAPAEAPG